ncbi:probable 2-oxoglutarate-dependent dioxygenase AOP1 [Humulus lupulus]|uniref:probable 2-oxoglutarate-dependent dioxygenase AOP1 n=1 Tax=Humulus lupulus TaxID=3486 RepID=UPI002B416D2F|nr:probable 2-oxoglutarate-dependent dioxygenase AOP1 [Humulus lupulus]
MGSETEHKIPVIDLTKNLMPGTDEWTIACKEARNAFEEIGCFEVVYDKIPLELRNSVFDQAKHLFNLPIETKMQVTSDKPYYGYFGQYSFLPLYESLGVDNPTTLEGSQKFTNLMWPQGNDTFCEKSQAMSKELVELYEIVTRMVFDSYGLDSCEHETNIGLTSFLLRYFKYREKESNEKSEIGLHSHTDRTFMSIVHQHQLGGLQVKSKDGYWIDVKPSPTSFLIIAGDVIGVWSNDRVVPCDHRIIMNENNKARYSIGLFAFIDGVIHVPRELIDDEYPLKYKPIDNFDWLRFKATEYPIKTYFRIKDS